MFNGYFPWHLENVTQFTLVPKLTSTYEPHKHLSGIKDKQENIVMTGYTELLN